MFFDIFRTEAGFVGLTFSLFFFILAMQQSIWCWIMRICSILAYLIPLYVVVGKVGGAFMWVAASFILIDIYGWYIWASIKEKESDLPVENEEEILDVYFTQNNSSRYKTALLSDATHLKAFLGLLLIWLISLFTVDYWFSPYAWYGFTLLLRLLAEFFLARKWIESWLVWAAADLCFMIPYCITSQFSYIAIYSVPVLLAVVGYLSWRSIKNKETPVATA